jgi:FkbM family methyltransferase
MSRDSLYGSVGRSLLRLSPAGIRRWVWDRVWWRQFGYTAQTADGVRMSGDTTDLIQRFVYYFGQWEPAISDWLRANLKAGDTVIDVGANVGWYSLLAARLVGPAGKVVSVEASPTIAKKLAANIGLNPDLAGRITVHQCAAGDHEGEISLYSGAAENSGQTTTVGTAGAKADATVPLKPLSTILAGVDLQKVRVIKIDVEGAEASVVAGLVPVAK